MRLSVVIPVYRSQETLEELVDTLRRTLEGKLDFEVILVDDHSPDDSYLVCKRLADRYRFVRCVRLSRNFGQQHAKLAGLHFVTGDYVVYMDDDLQNPPEHILDLVNAISDGGHDAVYGYSKSKQQSFFKNIGSRLNDLMASWLLDKPKELKLSSYYIFTRLISDELKAYKGPYPYPSGTILQLTRNIGSVEIPHRPRKAGRSGYDLRKLVRLWVNGFVGFSVAPLRLAALTGALIALLGFAGGLALVLLKLFAARSILPGWTSLMALFLFLSGIQLLFLGLVGEYVGRVLLMVNGKPQFLIREVYEGAARTAHAQASMSATPTMPGQPMATTGPHSERA